MASLHHSSPRDEHHPAETARTARIGLALFAVYTLMYAAFMVVNAFVPHVMQEIAVAGLNWAVFSGLLLIVAAFVLALAYVWLCRRQATEGRR